MKLKKTSKIGIIVGCFFAKFASAGWLVEQWWKVRRFFTRTFRDRTWYYNAKNRYLRGKRGWGSQDWWNLSDYVAETLPSALRHLAKESHGHPMSIYDVDGKDLTHEETSETPDTLRVHTLTDTLNLTVVNDEEDFFDAAQLLWEETLERMAVGFEAFTLLCEKGWRHDTEAEKELERLYREGFMLFYHNFFGLWD